MTPKGWFVKDFAEGWIFFDNEADALQQVEATGATMLLGMLARDALKTPPASEVGVTPGIIKRLREPAEDDVPLRICRLMDEAADEIERVREVMDAELAHAIRTRDEYKAENAALRGALAASREASDV